MDRKLEAVIGSLQNSKPENAIKTIEHGYNELAQLLKYHAKNELSYSRVWHALKIHLNVLTKYRNIVPNDQFVPYVVQIYEYFSNKKFCKKFIGELMNEVVNVLLIPKLPKNFEKNLIRVFSGCIRDNKVEYNATVHKVITVLTKKLPHFGEYDLQLIALETMYSWLPEIHKRNHLFFANKQIVQKSFKNVKRAAFEITSRVFINDLNDYHDNVNVLSIAADFAFLGDKQLKLSKIQADKDKTVWVDFNFGSENLSIFCDGNCLKVDLPNTESEHEPKDFEYLQVDFEIIAEVSILSWDEKHAPMSDLGSTIYLKLKEGKHAEFEWESSEEVVSHADHLTLFISHCTKLRKLISILKVVFRNKLQAIPKECDIVSHINVCVDAFDYQLYCEEKTVKCESIANDDSIDADFAVSLISDHKSNIESNIRQNLKVFAGNARLEIPNSSLYTLSEEKTQQSHNSNSYRTNEADIMKSLNITSPDFILTPGFSSSFGSNTPPSTKTTPKEKITIIPINRSEKHPATSKDCQILKIQSSDDESIDDCDIKEISINRMEEILGTKIARRPDKANKSSKSDDNKLPEEIVQLQHELEYNANLIHNEIKSSTSENLAEIIKSQKAEIVEQIKSDKHSPKSSDLIEVIDLTSPSSVTSDSRVEEMMPVYIQEPNAEHNYSKTSIVPRSQAEDKALETIKEVTEAQPEPIVSLDDTEILPVLPEPEEPTVEAMEVTVLKTITNEPSSAESDEFKEKKITRFIPKNNKKSKRKPASRRKATERNHNTNDTESTDSNSRTKRKSESSNSSNSENIEPNQPKRRQLLPRKSKLNAMIFMNPPVSKKEKSKKVPVAIPKTSARKTDSNRKKKLYNPRDLSFLIEQYDSPKKPVTKSPPKETAMVVPNAVAAEKTSPTLSAASSSPSNGKEVMEVEMVQEKEVTKTGSPKKSDAWQKMLEGDAATQKDSSKLDIRRALLADTWADIFGSCSTTQQDIAKRDVNLSLASDDIPLAEIIRKRKSIAQKNEDSKKTKSDNWMDLFNNDSLTFPTLGTTSTPIHRVQEDLNYHSFQQTLAQESQQNTVHKYHQRNDDIIKYCCLALQSVILSEKGDANKKYKNEEEKKYFQKRNQQHNKLLSSIKDVLK